MKYIAYCRKSREEKDKQILSISAQIAELKEYAKREHLEISEFVEEEKTAKVPGRNKFAQVLNKIENGHADGIIAWHPDRLARNSIDGGKIIYLLDTGKLLDLKFPTSWFENTPQGKFMLNIAFGQSKYYVDNLSENVKRGLRQKIRNGVWPSRATYGYVNNPKTRGVDVDIEKSITIKKAFQLFGMGDRSFTQIAEYLYKFNVRNKNNKPLHINQIRKMLSDKFYVGIMSYNGEYHAGAHECFISKELFQAVQKQLMLRNRRKIRRYNFAFIGLMKCGECGASITADQHIKKYKNGNSQTFTYYRCTKKLKPCLQKYIQEPEMEQQFRNAISDVALPQEWAQDWYKWLERDDALERNNSGENLNKLNLELEDLDRKLNILLDSYLDQIIDAGIYKNKKNEIFDRKLELQEEIAKMESGGSSRLEPMKEFIDRALECGKIARAKNTKEDLAIFAKTVGSNFFLQNRRLSVSFKLGFSTIFLERQAQAQPLEFCRDSLSVGMQGIEPWLPHPQRGVLPLYYIPKFDILHYNKKLLQLVHYGQDSRISEINTQWSRRGIR